MVIDVFCHHSTERVEEMISKAYRTTESLRITPSPQPQPSFPVEAAKPDFRLRRMDKYGIDMQALSQTAPALYGIGARDAAEICSAANGENYTLCKAYPSRFVNICILSLLDVKTAMDELDRSINELDCRGITLASNQHGKGLDSPEYFQVYEKMADHDLPLFLHPTFWESYPLADMANNIMGIFGWPFDTTQAVCRLIMGGVLDRFPSLKIVTHHMGAMLPYFSGRVEMVYRMMRERSAKDITEYWPNIYGDTALSGGKTEAYQLGYAFFGPERLMYGSDYPFGPEEGEFQIRGNLVGIKSINAPALDMEKILGGNAKKLLRIG